MESNHPAWVMSPRISPEIYTAVELYKMERIIGFEPIPKVWKTPMLAANTKPALNLYCVTVPVAVPTGEPSAPSVGTVGSISIAIAA